MATTYSSEDKPEQQQTPRQTGKERYDALAVDRAPYLERAREAARLTIPALVPPEGGQNGAALYQPFQSLGARGVNNLTAKLLLALFPPGNPFFRLALDLFVADELQKAQSEIPDLPTELEAALSKTERAVIMRMEQRGLRAVLSEVLKHLVAAGNVLMEVLPGGGARLHPLSNYVVKRDKSGNPLEICVLERFDRRTLPEAAAKFLDQRSDLERAETTTPEKTVEIITCIRRTRRGWTVWQELSGHRIPDSAGTYPLEKTPWLPLRFTRVDGEDYGRGHVEEYIGDLKSLEAASRSIVQFGMAASKILWFVNESGVTSKKKVADAPSGAVIDGDARDVSLLMMEKFGDFQVVKAVADSMASRLEHAFLLMMPRQAERVTAEEIRALVNELEQSLGGVYAVLSQELQLPLVRRVMHQMQKEGSLPMLPEKAVSPQIIAGVEALGRSSDLAKLDIFLAGVAQMFPDSMQEYVNTGVYMKRRAAALGIELEGLIRSEEEVQEARQAAQQAELAKAALAPGIKAASDQTIAAQQGAAQSTEGGK